MASEAVACHTQHIQFIWFWRQKGVPDSNQCLAFKQLLVKLKAGGKSEVCMSGEHKETNNIKSPICAS